MVVENNSILKNVIGLGDNEIVFTLKLRNLI